MIEDDPKIVAAVEKTLALSEGFVLQEAANTAQAALPAAIRLKPDLILLDIRLHGGGDGRAVLKELKSNAATRSIPVILLTGMGGEGDKVAGLNLGADDYVVKPFGAMELLARIQAVVRRSRPGGPVGVIEAGALRMDPANRTASYHGKELRLQPKEFEILLLLASQPGQAVTRAYLIENSSSYGQAVETRSLDTHIKNLRKKLEPRLIETVPKLGYRFVP